MTNEQLMMPRYEVVRGYPNCPFEVGVVLHIDHEGEAYSKECGYPKSVHRVMQEDLESYAANFKPLQWWENRRPEDLPEYVKYWDTSLYFPVDIVAKCYPGIFADAGFTSDRFEPATKEEYETYLSNKHKQKK